MAHLVRDTAFSYLLRFAFGAKVLPYPDEVDLPNVWRAAVHEESTTDRDAAAEKDAVRQKNEESENLAVQDPSTIREKHRSADARSEITVVDAPSSGSKENGEKKSPENAEHGPDHLLVGWYGPDDVDNPQNWTRGRKLWILFQTCFLTWAIYIGSSIYTAGITDIEQIFGVSDVAATLGLSLFVAGYGLGPMLFAPLTEIPQIGRMPVYMATLVVFVLFQIPTAKATNFGMLLAFRFLTGFFGSPILAVGGATISDIYAPRYRAYAITIWGLFATLGPVLGPLIGGFAAAAEGWTWTIWELMWLSGFALVLLFFFYPETSASTILYYRARRMRRATGNHNLRAQSELDAANFGLSDVVTIALIRPITLNFTEPIVLALNLYIGLVYALLYLWFESFPIVFIGIYGFTEQTIGLSYIGILIGAIAVTPPFFAYLKYVQEPKYTETGDLKPETRMPVAIFGAFILPICLFWFGWTARESVHWIVPIIGSSLFGFAVLLLFNVVLNYLADAYPLYAASVLAGNDLVRSAFGAGFPLFARAMYNRLGVAWATSLLGFLACAFIPIPILLYRYGEQIRLRSKRARHDY